MSEASDSTEDKEREEMGKQILTLDTVCLQNHKSVESSASSFESNPKQKHTLRGIQVIPGCG